MTPPHAVKALSGEEEGELIESANTTKLGAVDDFDSVFGEGSPVKRRPSPKKPKDPIKMTREEANDLIKDILSRKPPTISPTLPRLHGSSGDLREMNVEPLGCDVGPGYTRIPGTKTNTESNAMDESGSRRARSRPLSVTSRPATARLSSARSSAPQDHTTKTTIVGSAMGVPTGELGTNALAGGKFRDYISMVESIHKKEQFADTLEDWKNVIKALEKTETIESAKVPRDLMLLAGSTLLASWIAEHLVDLIVKRTQAKCIVSSPDPPMLLSLATQISVFRETARQLHLRGHHYLLSAHTVSISRDAAPLSNYQGLDQFINSLCKL